jgi:dTDP-4-amino-4,6-dideoxygalactose transaminase
MIPVTKPYLPNRSNLDKYIDGIYERKWLTNNGPLVQELTERLEKYLGVQHLLLVSNGTVALQIAYKALGISSLNQKPAPEAITTPFTFVATASAMKWEGINPIFVDIDKDTWCLNTSDIELAITENTRAIVPVHVFGNPCNVEEISEIANRHNLKVIYDAAHAFGVNYDDFSVLNWGDAATLSFHATKIFHTVEGGAVVFKSKDDLDKARRLINFGLNKSNEIEDVGINAKMSEFNAAMGLAVLDEIDKNILERETVWKIYDREFPSLLKRQLFNTKSTSNFAYFPVLLDSELETKSFIVNLNDKGIYPRRYFYPSLADIPQFKYSKEVPVSRDIASRIICMPLYSGCPASTVIKAVQESL